MSIKTTCIICGIEIVLHTDMRAGKKIKCTKCREAGK